ncbi:hypothetical protein FKM82_008369 [Ascaphus truei]
MPSRVVTLHSSTHCNCRCSNLARYSTYVMRGLSELSVPPTVCFRGYLIPFKEHLLDEWGSFLTQSWVPCDRHPAARQLSKDDRYLIQSFSCRPCT